MRRKLLTVYLLLILLSHRGFAEEKPNIVLFFVDDLGWSDLGFRNPAFESPNIDMLAREGLSFEQAYIASPTCSPSRATLLTGKHPARLKLVRHIPVGPKHPEFDKFGRTDKEFNLWETGPAQFPCRNWLPLEHTTYAEALRELGYYNLFVGKWHLGHEKYHPIHQGFDRQIGTSNWGHPRSYHPPYFKNSSVLADEKERYVTDKVTDETVKFIEQYDRGQPFMLSFWYYLVHGPHQGCEDLVKHFEAKGLTGKPRRMGTRNGCRKILGCSVKHMKATPELIKRGIKAALESPAQIDGLVLKHYDGASFSHMRAFKQGMIEGGVQGLTPTIGKEVEEMKLDGYARINGEFVEEWAVETHGTGTARYYFDNVSGAYDVRITYFDEDDGQGRVTLYIAGEQRASFKLDEDVDCWRWRLFENIRVNNGDEIKLAGQADGAEQVRLDYIEFIPRKRHSFKAKVSWQLRIS